MGPIQENNANRIIQTLNLEKLTPDKLSITLRNLNPKERKTVEAAIKALTNRNEAALLSDPWNTQKYLSDDSKITKLKTKLENPKTLNIKNSVKIIFFNLTNRQGAVVSSKELLGMLQNYNKDSYQKEVTEKEISEYLGEINTRLDFSSIMSKLDGSMTIPFLYNGTKKEMVIWKWELDGKEGINFQFKNNYEESGSSTNKIGFQIANGNVISFQFQGDSPDFRNLNRINQIKPFVNICLDYINKKPGST